MASLIPIQNFYNELLAMIISRFNDYSNLNTTHSYIAMIKNMDSDRAVKVASKIQKYTTFGDILQQLKSYTYDGALSLIAKELLHNGEDKQLDIKSVLMFYTSILKKSDIRSLTLSTHTPLHHQGLRRCALLQGSGCRL